MLCRLHLAAPQSPLRSRGLWPRTSSLFEELEREMDSMWERLTSNWQPTASSTASHETIHSFEAANTDHTFAVTQDMAGFDPQELVVKLVGEKVVLTGRKATEKPNGPFRYELFRRVWDVPQSVDRDRLSCFISHDGQLRIEAPVADSAMRTVPIAVNRVRNEAQPAAEESTPTEDNRAQG
ncbi:heat shock protein hsp-16.2-like [Candoia aspera]|uniref:heat shock protein hsp-16.2-like n=1 Tax=Candoia aspera TaxID=51853 RepID=UPI002FD7EABC